MQCHFAHNTKRVLYLWNTCWLKYKNRFRVVNALNIHIKGFIGSEWKVQDDVYYFPGFHKFKRKFMFKRLLFCRCINRMVSMIVKWRTKCITNTPCHCNLQSPPWLISTRKKWPPFRIFRCIFVNKKCCTLIKISLKFVPMVLIDNNPALV